MKKKKFFIYIGMTLAILITVTLGWGIIRYVTAEPIDLLAEMEFRESGIEGAGELKVTPSGKQVVLLPQVEIELANAENLSNGDEVEVQVKYNKLDFFLAGKKPVNTTTNYKMQHLLTTNIPWEELPEKDKLYDEIMKVAAQHEQDYLQYLKNDAAENLGGNPEVWIDYTLEKVYYGLDTSKIFCVTPFTIENLELSENPHKECNEMLIIFKVQRHIQEPYFYKDSGIDYVGFDIKNMYTQHGKLIMDDIFYTPEMPAFYTNIRYDENNGLQFPNELEEVQF